MEASAAAEPPRAPADDGLFGPESVTWRLYAQASVGVGIGTPAQAAEVCAFADGVVVGSALMKRIVGGDVEGAIQLATAFRTAIPS